MVRGAVNGMEVTSIADQNNFFGNTMVTLPVVLTRVDSMMVVEASADGEKLDDLIAHCELNWTVFCRT